MEYYNTYNLSEENILPILQQTWNATHRKSAVSKVFAALFDGIEGCESYWYATCICLREDYALILRWLHSLGVFDEFIKNDSSCCDVAFHHGSTECLYFLYEIRAPYYVESDVHEKCADFLRIYGPSWEAGTFDEPLDSIKPAKH